MSTIQTYPAKGTQTNTNGLANALQANAKPCTLLSLIGYNSNASAQNIQIHDSATAPADGTTPLFAFEVPGKTTFSLDTPLILQNGCYVCNSSTLATKTLGSADCWFVARTI